MNESKNLISARCFDQIGDGANAAIFYNKALLSGESFRVDDLFNAAVLFMLLDDFKYGINSSVPDVLKFQCYEIAEIFLNKVDSSEKADVFDVEFWKTYIKFLAAEVDEVDIPAGYFESGAISACICLSRSELLATVDLDSIFRKAINMNSERGRYILSIIEKYKPRS